MKHSSLNSNSVKKNITEASLWLLFLFVCGLLGYFQGMKPNFKVSDYVIKPTEVRILTVSELFFPTEIVREIESSTHTHLVISKISDWNQLKVQLIASPAPDILLIPQHWALGLQKETLLHTDSALKSQWEKQLSTDFTQGHDFFLPTFWAQLSFVGIREPIKSAQFLKDADLWVAYQDYFKKNPSLPLAKASFEFLDLDSWLQTFSNKSLPTATDVALAPHTYTTKTKKSTQPTSQSQSHQPDSFYVWGFALSKNAPQIQLSLEILKYYTSNEVQIHILGNLPLATSFQSLEGVALPKEKKSSYLRTLDFNDLILLKAKDPGAEDKLRTSLPDVH